ncbi:MAG: hypothetical protein WAM14_18105 [Candidatus Nitrosopolaris sp.]
MKIDKKTLVRFFALALPLVSAIVVTTLPFQAANAQITPAQQQALRSLVATGYTNHYPLKIGIVPNPPPSFSIPYSINLGQVIAMAADQPRTSLDIILAPTQHQTRYGIFTIQIPRNLIDSKTSSNTDQPFRVTLDGHGLAWQQLQETNTYRVLGIYFGPQNGFLEIFGTTISTG